MAPRRPSLMFPLIAVLTLGFAPYVPHAHIWKQLVNLRHGRLTAPIDIFDLVLHGLPWVWLTWALVQRVRDRGEQGGNGQGGQGG